MPRRRIIRNQSIGSILFTLLGLLPWNWWAHSGCPTPAPGTVAPLCLNFSGIFLDMALLIFLAAAILYVVALIEALRRCIRMKTRRWLLAIVPFGPLGTLLYSLAGPKDTTRETHDWWAYPKKRHKRQAGD